MLKKLKIIFGVFLASFVLLSTKIASAQDFGFDPVSNTIALAQGDPRTIIGRIIQIILSFLGVILLGLIIYAGFLWMTSGGEEDKIRSAKNILKNAVIGLAVTLAAWAITTFVLTKLSGAISGSGGNQSGGSTSNLGSSGLGVIGSCTVQTIYPENNQKDVPRNTSIMVTFKEEVDLSNVCVNASGSVCACDNAACNLINPEVIRIFKNELSDACSTSCPSENTNVTDVALAFSGDKKTLIMSPLSYLGSSEANTNYSVKITSALNKTDGTSMFRTCSSDELYWTFEVSSRLDLTPPQVVPGFLFPRPDNEADISGISVPAVNATAEIFVNGCPKVYAPATVVDVTPAAEVSLNYHGVINRFKVSVPADAPDKAQLFNANTNALLGISDFDDEGLVTFSNYLSLKSADHPVGSLWEISIVPEVLADTLTVGDVVYIFATTGENNNIIVSSGACNVDTQATNIQAKLSGHPDINVSRLDSKLTLTAKVAGVAGNSLVLSTSNSSALSINPFSGGTDSSETYTIQDKKDVPMNAVVKISFNEAMNPITLSGSASEMAPYIKLINADGGKSAGSSCADNSECLSYKCDNYICVGDYVNGHFMVSGNYRTVEFISDNECGINGCGEKVYCLPANSHLALEVKAANLKACSGDQDCAAFNPYKTCIQGALSYKTCQDSGQRNYPAANVMSLDGAIDAAFNSLDGNRDTIAYGPVSTFNENEASSLGKDNYRFSFYVNDQKELSSPRITAITPTSGASGITALSDPVEITFNTLMMSSTLRSGSVVVDSAQGTVEHKFVNLKSSEATPLGYWVAATDKDASPLDGVADITIAKISHSPFVESVSYGAQVGSGVKDIYQNCFKPSSGPDCEASWENPSCCFGTATSDLDDSGNCQ